MKARSILRNGVIAAIIAVNTGCDQVTKTIVRKEMDYNEPVRLLADHLTLTKVENSGAFLSFGNALPEPLRLTLLCLLPLIVLTLAIRFVLTNPAIDRKLLVGICFVIGGGLGNLYDRIIYGSVTDFLHIDFVLFQTGVFNMADVSITAGMILILGSIYFSYKPRRLNPAPAGEEV